jgi:hypothetical protein
LLLQHDLRRARDIAGIITAVSKGAGVFTVAEASANGRLKSVIPLLRPEEALPKTPSSANVGVLFFFPPAYSACFRQRPSLFIGSHCINL